MPCSRLIAPTLGFFLFAVPAVAQTSYPMLTRIEPAAAQRGQSVEITIAGGGSFEGASQLLCQGPGLSGEILSVEKPPPAPAKGKRVRRPLATVKARLHVSANAPLGPREVRVATLQGVSSVGLVMVVNDPVVAESDDKANDQAPQAQAIPLPSAIAGTIGKPEDVDWYSFTVKAGQRVTFSVWANRLENKIHDLQAHFDPILSVYNAQGRELAVDDNHDFADPMLSYEFKEAGTAYIQIRDTTYAGNPNWTYVLQATAGPYATSVFPMAVNPGAISSLHAQGFNFDLSQTMTLDVPKDVPTGSWLTSLPTAQGSTLALPLVVTKFPVVTETGDAPSLVAKAQKVAFPAAISGRLGEPNDADVFQFEAKKGTVYAFEVIARRAGAATDPVLKVVNDKDALQAQADDTFGKDPRLEWTAPADGVFGLQVSDLHSRGGDGFGYVLAAEVAEPDFLVTCDPDKINVGPGGRVPVFVQVTRRTGFSGPVTLLWDGLPQGVSASPLTVPANMTEGVMVVSAAADAKPAAGFVALRGKGDAPKGPIVRTVSPKQEIYFPGGGRGFWPVETFAIGVTDPSDITVEAKPHAITLAPGSTATIDIKVTRDADYKQGVNLAVILQHLGGIHGNPLPPGVVIKEAGSKTLLGPTETVGKVILEAKPDAQPCDKVPICVMGHVSINFVVKTAYASEPILITVPAKGGAPAK
ncbi:MAG: PPC domain-containing protein [Isosphaeraceae bacterium]|nr:PPC domain-containing protein [Isosphaeraceae bacterium]